MRVGSSWLHPRFVTTLLNDLFGIQSRAGCSCAAPYGHRILHIDERKSRELRRSIADGNVGLKPGWARVNFHFLHTDLEVQFICQCIRFVAEHGKSFLPLYSFDIRSGAWRHRDFVPARIPFGLAGTLTAEPARRYREERPDLVRLFEEYLSEALAARGIHERAMVGERLQDHGKRPDPLRVRPGRHEVNERRCVMPAATEGPASPLFTPVRIKGRDTSTLHRAASRRRWPRAFPTPRGAPACIAGSPSTRRTSSSPRAEPPRVSLDGTKARWLVFLHTSDARPLEYRRDGFISPMRGEGRLGELACTYRLKYRDGTEAAIPVHRRFQIGSFTKRWGENCFEAVAHHAPHPLRASHEQLRQGWGKSQTRVDEGDAGDFLAWMYAWENPRPDAAMDALACEPASGTVVLFGLAAGTTESNPLRWDTRRKALLTLPEGAAFPYELDEAGLLEGVRLDLGQVISARPRPVYPDAQWEESFNNQLPGVSTREVLLEFTAHAQAVFHLAGGVRVPASALGSGGLSPLPPSTKRVVLRVVEEGSGTPVPVKLHVHGAAGEYLAPVDRHRIPNAAWFEDYSVDFVHRGVPDGAAVPQGGASTGAPTSRVRPRWTFPSAPSSSRWPGGSRSGP